MSGSIGDWMGAQNTGNVLSGIANPKTPNVLGMYSDVAGVANRIWQNREMQAKQLAGQAFQQSVNPDGTPNQEQLNKNLVAAGPTAALAAQTSSQEGLTNTTGYYNLHMARLTGMSNAMSTLSAQYGGKPPQDAINTAIDEQVARKLITPEEGQQAKGQFSADPAANGQKILQNHIGNLQAQQALLATQPTTGTQTGPGGRTIGFTQQPGWQGGGVSSTTQPGAPQGMSAEDANQIVQVPYPKLNPDGTPNSKFGSTFPMRKGDIMPLLPGTQQVQGGGASSLPPSLRNPANAANAPGGPGAGGGGVGAKAPATAAPAAPAYAPANPGAAGGGIGAVLNPQGANAVATTPPAATVVPGPDGIATVNVTPHPAVATPPAPAAPATPPAAVVAPPAPVVPPPASKLPPNAPQASLQGGVPIASANALAPNVGPPGPPNPLVAGDVAAIMAGRAQARGAPIAGTQTAQAPFFGSTPSAADIDQQKKSVDRFQDISDQAVPSRGRSAVLGNMLGDTKAFTTGPLASRIEAVRAWGNRFGLPVSTEGLSAAESFNKLAAQLANAQGATTDARLGVNQAANPHAELSPAGVDLMLRQLQGNEDYIQARAKLASSYPNQDARRFENEIGSRVDPRAFQFARMTQEQRQTYYNGLSDQDKAAVKSSYNWLQPQGLVGD